MKIRKLHLKNIGVFDDEEIEFKECDFNKGKEIKDRKAEIHILTGENGTGKTTILQALACVFDSSILKTEWVTLKKIEEIKSGKCINGFHKKFRFFDGKTKSKAKSKSIVTFETKDEITVFGDLDYKNISSYVKGRTLDEELYYFFYNGFPVFAFSGYRQIESETVQANYLPKDFNPLSQSLEFIKDYSKFGEITVNQLIANNISNRALSKEDGSLEEAKRYEAVINAIETFIKDVTDYEVKFVLKRSPNELKLKMHGEELDFDVLPDGLRSLISWIADLLGRVDLLKWADDLPITEKNLILLLDEIEVHLHPAWQRKVLPVVQKLFKNAQIFVSTHSPFVVNSVDDAWVYKLKVENGKAKVDEVVKSENSNSITQVLREIFGIEQWFGLEVQNNLEQFKRLKNKLIANGTDEKIEKELLEKAKILADEPNDQLKQIVRKDLEELSEIKKKPYTL